MVKLTKIYTRGGDNGETSLGDGSRVKKHSGRIATTGAVRVVRTDDVGQVPASERGFTN